MEFQYRCGIVNEVGLVFVLLQGIFDFMSTLCGFISYSSFAHSATSSSVSFSFPIKCLWNNILGISVMFWSIIIRGLKIILKSVSGKKNALLFCFRGDQSDEIGP